MGAPENLTRDAIERVLTAAQKNGHAIKWWSVSPGPGSVGFPDFLVCAAGKFVAVEAKASPEDGGKAPTKAQLGNLADLTDAGGLGIVVNTEATFHQLHQMLVRIGGEFPCPHWRSRQVLTRRKPPPLRGS